MTILHFILILTIPLIGFFIGQLLPDLSVRVLKRISVGLTIWNLLVLLSPISFAGENFDFFIFLLCLLSFSLLLFKKQGSTYPRLFKQIGILFISFVFLFLEAIVSQFTGITDLSSYLTIQKITTDGNYRLVHRKVNTNFMYSGTHLISIKKQLTYLPIFEYRLATINAGQYFDNAVPSQTDYSIDEKNHKLIMKSGTVETFSY